MIFFGAISGVVFGNVTVSTPFSMDAFIFSSCSPSSQHRLLP